MDFDPLLAAGDVPQAVALISVMAPSIVFLPLVFDAAWTADGAAAGADGKQSCSA